MKEFWRQAGDLRKRHVGALAIVLANLQGPKLTVIFGLQTSLGVIFYSSIFFATDVLS